MRSLTSPTGIRARRHSEGGRTLEVAWAAASTASDSRAVIGASNSDPGYVKISGHLSDDRRGVTLCICSSRIYFQSTTVSSVDHGLPFGSPAFARVVYPTTGARWRGWYTLPLAPSSWTTTPAMTPTQRYDAGGRSWARWGCFASLHRRRGRRGRSLLELFPWNLSCALACPPPPRPLPNLNRPPTRPLMTMGMASAQIRPHRSAPAATRTHPRVLPPPLPSRLLAVDRLGIIVGLVGGLAASRPSSASASCPV